MTTPGGSPGILLRTMKPVPKNYVADWRKAKGWSQERLAEALETTKATISRIEAGKQNWDAAFLEACAEQLNATPSDLLRRRPSDPDGIQTEGLKPDQVQALQALAEQLRKVG